MRIFGTIESRHGVDEIGYEPPARDEEVELDEQPRVERRAPPAAIALGVLAASTFVVSMFLPFAEAEGVLENTLAQSHQWEPLILGVLIAISAALRVRGRGASVLILGVLAAVDVVVLATDHKLRTFYPTENGRIVPGSQGTVYPPGIAIYVAGVGALLAIAAGVLFVLAPRTRRCPWCAESVLEHARVCRHCGRDFEQGDTEND